MQHEDPTINACSSAGRSVPQASSEEAAHSSSHPAASSSAEAGARGREGQAPAGHRSRRFRRGHHISEDEDESMDGGMAQERRNYSGSGSSSPIARGGVERVGCSSHRSHSHQGDGLSGSGVSRRLESSPRRGARGSGRRPRSRRSRSHSPARLAGSSGGKQFFLQSKEFSLTYPQCDISRDEFTAAFQLAFAPDLAYFAREQHKDGHYHMHVFASWKRPLVVRSMRYFDVAPGGVSVPGSGGDVASPRVYHPNIQRCKSSKNWIRYIAKGKDHDVPPQSHDVGGDGGVGELASFNPSDHPLGSRSRLYQDLLWTARFVQQASLREISWPVRLVTDKTTYLMEQPSAALKRRHWWIVAEPNAGKTKWINKTFRGTKIYCPRMGKYPYEGYAGESLIIYDDRSGVSFAEFSDVCNTWDIPHPIYGEVRYVTADWPLSKTRNVIVLSNHTVEESMPAEDHLRMKKRFIQIVNPKLIEDDEKSDDEVDPDQQAIAESALDDFQERKVSDEAGDYNAFISMPAHS